METNYIALAIPAFVLLIGVELLVARHRNQELYRLNDTVNDLSTGVIQQILGAFIKLITLGGYIAVFEGLRLFDLPSAGIGIWLLCFIGVDLIYYWFHRLSHEVNFLWAAHVVHHQSEEYNLAVALRQSALQQVFSATFYWPLALLGFPPLMFATCTAFQTLYQFWLHTQTIPTLGPFEWVFVTPSQHRVHHGRNPIYLDRNHGGTFIVWDRLFGTFQKEEEEVVYGVTTPLASWNPLWANLQYWVELAQSAGRTSRLRDKLLVYLKPPGWFPEDLGGTQPPPTIGDNPSKFDFPYPRALGAYVILQFFQLLAFSAGFIFLSAQLSAPARALAAVAVTWGLANLGGLFETRRWAYTSEWLRLLATPAIYIAVSGGEDWIVPALLALNVIPAFAMGIRLPAVAARES